MSDDVFAPPVERWSRVSPALATVRRIVLCGGLVLVGVVAAVAAQLLLGLAWLAVVVAVAALAGAAWAWVWAGRNQRAWGYAENADDLYVTSGVMWRRLVVVPYGRMQFVDVSAGPVERTFNIATVTLHTASSGTSAHVPGLTRHEADRLRDRLTELGEARAAGL